MFSCVFVLDLFNSAVVHAVMGVRENYLPIDRFSAVVKSSNPISIIEELQPKRTYLADLNRLTGTGNNQALIEEISRRTVAMADTGISTLDDLQTLPATCTPVLGTETATLELIRMASGRREINVSIDMRNRQIVTRDPALMLPPLDLLRKLGDLPIREIILLDLDRVGTSAGIDRYFLGMAARKSDHPLLLGGGVRGIRDLEILEDLGFEGALVATAVHSGKIPLKFIQ